MLRVLCKNETENLFLVRESLTDESKVYNVLLGGVRIECIDEADAYKTFGFLDIKTLITV